ncbi:DUF2637 domain-containing protein, partial [Streptomyces venezuelae]|uniref:DUF2637 domain-containing protein n=1 Tax=Streptomyces venezuelae TaxID=54571 RepID=UPI0033178839
AARHAVGRIADITADRHMEGVRITRWLLSPVPTFKLWRRMKLWELRSYEQAVGMEQDRLIYQARLQARYGRSWRRKAPVEALMPLKLAKIGVPLAQTTPDALAATGIEPALFASRRPVVTLERDDGQQDASDLAGDEGAAPLSPETGEHDRAVEAGDPQFATPVDDNDREGNTDGSVPVPSAPRYLSDEELWAAYRSHAVGRGEYPDAAVFARHLAEAYGVTDPVTGGPLSRAVLEPALARGYALDDPAEHGFAPDPAAAGPGVEPADVADAADDRAVPEEAAIGGPSSPDREPAAAAPRTGQGDGPAGGGSARRTVSAELSTQLVAEPLAEPTGESAGESVTRVGDVTDTGAATARPSEKQTDESGVSPIQREIVMVAGWLAEAQEAGEKLSGAEAARRLGVSPKTGQRRVLEAARYLEENKPRRGHLRSVSG